MTNKRPHILYIINFYGTPPLNYFEKYVKEEDAAKLTVLKLPSVRPMKNRLLYDAFLLRGDGSRVDVKFSVWFPFPLFLIFIFQYIINIFISAYLVTKVRGRVDIGIGETSFGGALIRLLRLLGIVKYSVYMSGDVLPIFKGKILPYYFGSKNSLVRSIDKLIVWLQLILRKAGVKNDLVWYAAKSVKKWDTQNKLKPKDSVVYPAVTIDKNETKGHMKTKKEEDTLGYIGRLDEFAGVDMALESLVYIKKEIPKIKLLLVGGGTMTVQRYKEMAKKLGVEENVKFYGYVPEMSDALKIISRTKLGLALYKPSSDNVSLHADVAKPKEYLKVGVPVVITKKGPSVGAEIEGAGGGVRVKYDPKEVSETVVSLLRNKKEYKKLQEGVMSLGSVYDYRSNFKNLLEDILSKSVGPR